MNCECCGRNTFALGSLGPYCFECALTTIFEHRDRGRRNMSDKIKVGDRVEARVYGRATVIGEHIAFGGKRWLWIEYDSGHECYGVQATQLTRIEPEPVVLTPKYAVGQRVRLCGANTATEVIENRIACRLESGGYYYEDILEPIPEPCPECKGSGVASEGEA